MAHIKANNINTRGYGREVIIVSFRSKDGFFLQRQLITRSMLFLEVKTFLHNRTKAIIWLLITLQPFQELVHAQTKTRQ